ncbi:MAG: GNAT family N-acetyltransferase [Patescibacteria group bacterium]|nr:GNAT family N-acetyltransferase [Patescibacteria group bacterium]
MPKKRGKKIIDVTVRPTNAADLDTADKVIRLAFGTLFGMPDPMQFLGDGDLAHTRFKTDPAGILSAEIDGQLVGTSFATRWGSVAFIGPLTIHPDYWNRGIGQKLMDQTMEILRKWNVSLAGLFTLPDSPMHIHLYEKYGFRKQELSPLVSKAVTSHENKSEYKSYSRLSPGEQKKILTQCKELTDRIYPGLDLTKEIISVNSQKIGDMVLVSENEKLMGMAVCHFGAGSEGGSGVNYIKFAAIRPDPKAAEYFEKLLDAIESFASGKNLVSIMFGINTINKDAFERVQKRGYTHDFAGVIMQLHNVRGYRSPDLFVLDDWR